MRRNFFQIRENHTSLSGHAWVREIIRLDFMQHLKVFGVTGPLTY